MVVCIICQKKTFASPPTSHHFVWDLALDLLPTRGVGHIKGTCI